MATPKTADSKIAEPKAAEPKASALIPEAAKLSAARQRELESAISSITKAYGDGAIMRLGSAQALRQIEPTGGVPGAGLACRERRAAGLVR